MFRGRPVRFVLPLIEDDDREWLEEEGNLVTLRNSKARAHIWENDSVFVVPERLCNLGCETPRIHYEKYLGRPYRYFYAISSDVDANNPGTVSDLFKLEA